MSNSVPVGLDATPTKALATAAAQCDRPGDDAEDHDPGEEPEGNKNACFH